MRDSKAKGIFGAYGNISCRILIAVVMVISVMTDMFSFRGICAVKSTSSNNVSIGKSRLYMYVGQTYKFKNRNYSWKSSRKNIVSVNKKGKIIAKKAGTAKITAGIKVKKKVKKAVCAVKVGQYATDIKVNSASTIILKAGSTSTIKANVTPVKVLYTDIIYTSGNAGIAVVDKQGVITPVSEGVTDVTISSKAVNKQGKHIVKSVRVVVQGEEKPSEIPGLSSGENILDTTKDWTLGDYNIMTPTTTPVVPKTPAPVDDSKATEKPKITEAPTAATPDNTEATHPTPNPHATVSPKVTDEPNGPDNTSSPTAEPTNQPMPTLVPTSPPTEAPTSPPTPTPAPLTIKEYIDSLVPDANSPLAGCFVANNGSDCRTVYLLNKSYTGNVRLMVDDYVYSGSGSVKRLLNTLENDRMSAVNSAGTVKVYKGTMDTVWTVEFLTTGVKYYFTGSVNDSTFGSPYGVVIALGDTRQHISILAN